MSFWELFVVGVIALVVLGPERLPQAARTIGLWVGKAKRGFESVKSEIDRELKIKELQDQIDEQKRNLVAQAELESINGIAQDVNQSIDSIQSLGSTQIPDKPESANEETPSSENLKSAEEINDKSAQ